MFRADRGTDGRTDRRIDGQTDMTKLIVAFRNFANAPNTGILTAEFRAMHFSSVSVSLYVWD
jgi:hypothetical protein